jgi:hypothetical protein
MYELFVNLNGLIFPYDDSYVIKNGAPKPSTGMLVILNSILFYNEVKIVNFDSFRTNHYWKENSTAKALKFSAANNIIGNHQPILELSILQTLEKMKLIIRLT